MIEIRCDNCERSFEADPAAPGGKVPCPHCGDVNRMPPDAGPEREICRLHPAMFRAHPFRYLAVAALAGAGAALAIWAWTYDTAPGWVAWPGALMVAAAAAWWLTWFVAGHLWVGLRISNKRIIRAEGIIRRAISEVLHDHVRNVEIRQTFLQRMLNVGYLGISSSGQEGIEIEVHDIPRPYEVKKLIDRYRNM